MYLLLVARTVNQIHLPGSKGDKEVQKGMRLPQL